MHKTNTTTKNYLAQKPIVPGEKLYVRGSVKMISTLNFTNLIGVLYILYDLYYNQIFSLNKSQIYFEVLIKEEEMQ